MTYKHDYRGFGRLLRSPEMQATMGQIAERVKRRAEVIAPVDTGHYKESLGVTTGVDGDRAYGRVTADVPYAFQVEVGTKDTPAHRTLGRALDAANE